MLRRFAASLLLFSLSLGVCVVAAEFLLQLRSGRATVEREDGVKHHFTIYRPDPVLNHALRPSWSGVHEKFDFSVHVSTDANGFRSTTQPPAAGDAASPTRRILVLGDSFAFGWGVEDDETFASVLAQRLAVDGPVEVLNAAVPGYSADQYLLFLRTRGFALEPDLVLIALCSNDVEEIGWKHTELGEDRLPRRVQSLTRVVTSRGKLRFENEGLLRIPSFRFPGDDWLLERSALYSFLRFNLIRAYVAVAEARARPDTGSMPELEGGIDALPPEAIEQGLASSPEFRVAYHEFVMDAIEAELRERGIPLRTLRVEGVTKHVLSACDPETCLDQEWLFTRAARNDLFYELDAHWTPEAHHVVGEALADWLRDSGVLARVAHQERAGPRRPR